IFYFLVLSPRRAKVRPTAAEPEEQLTVAPVRPASTVAKPRNEQPLLPPAMARTLAKALFRVAIAAIFIWSFLPVAALVFISLSPATDLIRTPPSIFPSTLTLENYRMVLMAEGTTSVQAQRVPISLFNSFAIGVIVAVINVALGTLAGYGFARYANRRFFAVSLWALLLTRMVPALTLVLPFFVL